ncbi:Filament-like plant protein [Arabidopsis thaliana x Arabidopsis arenosa]|uniref:Filament-like plant protein n=1 Tax=Arabidopsis thaliana x Arabidopsis arenosa TaxID=1240361 RepID=A0A8T1XNE0_9BRAS|nr:Filament-like plant protein [Arabidopsis thaliana x Arabidopsis arenosa]
MDSKDELVKQHAKVAEDAVAGWEKAENEVVELKQKLEDAADKNIVLEDRVSHLDGALKECVRQLRQFRDEQEKKIQEAVTEMNKMKRHSM